MDSVEVLWAAIYKMILSLLAGKGQRSHSMGHDISKWLISSIGVANTETDWNKEEFGPIAI